MHLAKHLCRTLTGFLVLSTLACALAPSASADRRPLIGNASTATPPPATATSTTGLVMVVEPSSLQCVQTTTFETIAVTDSLGLDFDGILPATGVYFGERFAGQEMGANGNFDVVLGTPSNPLVIEPGLPGQNLDVFSYTSNVLVGLGHLGYPDFDAIGEGSIAMYFSVGQSQVSLEMVGGNGGGATLDFYRADGTLIDTVVLAGLSESPFGFATANGLPEISGIVMQNTDLAGLGIDNICHDMAVVKTRTSAWGALKAKYR